MGNWRVQMRPASFRGVPFHVEAAERAGGRKTVVHEYPQRDTPFVEDLGRKGRGFQIDGYINGDDVLDQMDRLLAALEQPGPGALDHPYYGQIFVSAQNYKSRFTKTDGGYGLVSMEFVETVRESPAPSIGGSPLASIDDVADAAHDGAAQSLILNSSRYTLSGTTAVPSLTVTRKPLPGFSFRSLSGLVTSWGSTVQTAMRPVASGADALASIQREIVSLTVNATGLVRSPVLLATRIGTMLKTTALLWPRTSSLGVSALLSAWSFVSSTQAPTGTTPTRTTERGNYTALDQYLRQVTVIEAARQAVIAAGTPALVTTSTGSLSSVGQYDTYEAAVATRDAVLAAIDVEAARAADDAYAALVTVRAAVAAGVPAPTDALPHLVSVTLQQSTPALAVAYRLYEDLALSDDLVARNRVRHPLFVPGSVPLQVRSHA